MPRSKLPRPKGKTWRTARLYSADIGFQLSKAPICGTHLVWAVVGSKWVRVVKPVTWQKFKCRRTDWDMMPTRLVR
jgi:hypothetical protein